MRTREPTKHSSKMAWTLFTQAQMDEVARQLFMPLILLVNYTLLLYLITFYWTRRSEPRVRLLFVVGIIGVVCLVPFSNPDDITVDSLNDASEACCVLTFLLQLTIIGRDLNKKIKFRTIQLLTYAAELLIVVDLTMVLLSLIVVFKHSFLTPKLLEDLHNFSENVTLAFIFGFRYYYIIVSLGVKDLYTNRKVEICWYVLFATHEVPFDLLSGASGLPWDFPRSLWNRVTLAGCLWTNARTKLRESSRDSKLTKSPSAYTTTTQPQSSLRPRIKSFNGAKPSVVAAAADTK